MEKEFIKNSDSSITLNITAGKIDSYRKNEETTTTVRVYSNGKIGVAGALGSPNEKALEEQAKNALSLGIPYVCALDEKLEKSENNACEIIPEREFMPKMQELLDRVGKECPNFAISNKITLYDTSSEYKNSNGRRLFSADSMLDVELLFQSRGSKNLMDCYYDYRGRSFNPDEIVEACRRLYDAYYTPVDIEEGEYSVVMDCWSLFGTFLRNFIGEMYASGASLVSGKLGEKVFSEKLTLANDRNPKTSPCSCFFDSEGQIAPDYRADIIERGVLKNVLTSKNTAAQFNLPVSKTSYATYDGVPQYGFSGLYVEPTAKSLSELVPEKAIFVMFASGGDTTPDGHFATPVQTSFLMEKGKLVGRLPELNISGDFFTLLRDGYIGSVTGDPSENSMYCAVKMKVTK